MMGLFDDHAGLDLDGKVEARWFNVKEIAEGWKESGGLQDSEAPLMSSTLDGTFTIGGIDRVAEDVMQVLNRAEMMRRLLDVSTLADLNKAREQFELLALLGDFLDKNPDAISEEPEEETQ